MRLPIQLALIWILTVELRFGWTAGRGHDEDSPTRAPSSYKWKAGPWGSCHSTTTCGEGSQSRQVWCVHLDDRTSLTVLCDANSIPSSVRPCFQVCEEHRGKLSWRVGDWGPCLPPGQESSSAAVASSSHLQQQRGASGGSGSLGFHSSSSSSVQVTFHSTSRHHLKGVMSRDVVCVYRRTNHSHIRLVSEEACLHFDMKPNVRLTCTVPRSQDCVAGEWSDWLPCRGCSPGNRTRMRRVLVAPAFGGRPCPPLAETEPCHEAVGCLRGGPGGGGGPDRIRQFRLRIGAWSECFSLEHNHEDPFSQYGFWPSVGYRTREVACKDDYGTNIDRTNCLGSVNPQVPELLQSCVVSVDCLVSSWSDWTVAKEGCVTQDGTVYSEIRRRSRYVLRVPHGAGEPCPNLEETYHVTDKGKLSSCTKYKWLPSEWNDCMLTEQMKIHKVACGGGIRRRNLTCLRNEDLVPVPPSFCVEPPPQVVQRCSIPCRQDCRVSSWSVWGPCQPLDCKDVNGRRPTGFQERFRTVLDEPSADGTDCPSLRQVDACEYPSCYQWRTTDFSPCLVLNKELRCGQGKQSRKAYCEDLAGNGADDAWCKIYSSVPELTVPCYIPCPNDCVLSPWSEWSHCSRICADKTDYGTRTRNRTVLAPSGLSGTPCPSPNELTENEFCNQHSCFGFGWKVSPWQPCKTDGAADICGEGNQARDVWCMKDDEKRVAERKCNPLPKPPDRRNCTLPCPRDCLLSKFSDWTPCNDACQQNVNEQALIKFQERSMNVQQWPEAGRPPCPSVLKEIRACPPPCVGGGPCSQGCNNYQWSTKEWGLCVLPEGVEFGKGFRTRGVTCVLTDREVEITYCLRANLTIPEAAQTCYVDRDHHCVFSEWSQWSTCPTTCGGTSQIRKRKLLGDMHKSEDCTNSISYPLEESRGCTCNVHSAQAEGETSDCILDGVEEATPINGVEVTGRCGVGRRFKRVACYDRNNQIADPFLCTPTGYEEDSCMMGCPLDCQMSAWSDWSSCSVLCGTGVQNRTRRILRAEFDGGRPCPQTDYAKVQREVRLCNVDCHLYQWMAYSWSPCELDSKSQHHRCGSGHKSRTVRCMRIENANKPELVREEFCDPVIKSLDITYCHVPCPQDCVVSDWGDWSSCPQLCDASHVRMRSRSIVRKPQQQRVACPLLEEHEACMLNNNCFHYSWNLTEWTSCTIPHGATCGEGVKQRGVQCLRSDGHSVESQYCTKSTYPRPKPEEMPCMMDCPIDCEVSAFSEWSGEECRACESTGVITRTRQITVHPSATGRPCPKQLMQKKPCPVRPCYHWHRAAWSECELEGGQCGHGRQRREVQCRRSNGTQVERKYCLEANASHLLGSTISRRWLDDLLDIQEDKPCFLPCPGDCFVSEWSEWSPCHRDCSIGEQVGVQTRSRAIEIHPSTQGEQCPRRLWETKPCHGGPCLTFAWQVRDNQVKCVRSDGLVVLGGCHSKPRPCVPPCRIPLSDCSHSGECMCESAYRPVYRDVPAQDGNRELLVCELISLTNSSHHTGSIAADSEIRVFYFPNDNEVSFWMYAMIAVGSAFVIFVAVTIYLMCHSSLRRGGSPLRRHSLTIRRNSSMDAVNAIKP